MKKHQLLRATILLSILTFTLQCGVSVQRLSTSQTTDLSGRWNDTDARLVAEEMTQDVVKRPWRTNFITTYQRQPVLVVGEILNKSHEHIATETFIKDIEREVLNAQAARIVTHGIFREKVRQERAEANHASNAVALQKKLGRELGADFILLGTINTIVDTKGEGKHRAILYQINLELVDLLNNEVVWIGDKKIKKLVKK
jgi:PBP1b-binding outer membrane lipoprotein LpoB